MREIIATATGLLKAPSRERLERSLLSAADIGIAGALVLTALALGGRHDVGRLVYALSAALAMLAVSLHGALRGKTLSLPRWPGILAAAAIAVPILQIIPLPTGVLAALAPGHADLLPLWVNGGPFGVWSTISLTPAETLEGAALLISHTMLFYAVHNRVQNESDARRLMGGIGLAALGMALLAVTQLAGWSNGKLLGLYSHPHRRFDAALMGSFANRNHLAHYLLCGAAGLIPLAWSAKAIQTSKKRRGSLDNQSTRWKRMASTLGVVALLTVALATMSRGGLIAMTAGTAVAVCLRWAAGRLRLADMVLLGSLALGVLLAVSFFDYERVTSRLDDLVSGEIEELDANSGRRLIWEANTSAFLANPWFGHGAGSHRYVYPAYIAQPAPKEYTHAESGYLQIASECGLAGLTVLMLTLATVGWGVVRGLRGAESDSRIALWAAVGATLAVSVTHSAVDFVWYLPSLAAAPIASAAIAWRLLLMQSLRTSPRGPRSPQAFAWPVLATTSATAAVLTCLWGPALGSPSWDTYVRAARSLRAQERPVAARQTIDPQNHRAAVEAARDRVTGLLAETVSHDSTNARAHARYADRCLLRFEQQQSHATNSMTLPQVRDTVAQGGFSSRSEAILWANRVFEENMGWLDAARRHARLALARSPLEAKAYLVNAELGFLHPGGPSLDSLIEQALRLRPQDGVLRYQIGRLYHAEGRLDEALEQYRLCLKMPGSHRERLVATLAPLLPAYRLVEALDPDGPATELLFASYRQLIPEDQRAGNPDLLAIADHAREVSSAEKETTPLQQARRWRRLSLFYREVGDLGQAVSCAERGEEILPNDFWVRHELAMALLRAEQDDRADSHLRWCLARRPDMRYLQSALKSLARRRADTEYQQREAERQQMRLATRQRSQEPETSGKQ